MAEKQQPNNETPATIPDPYNTEAKLLLHPKADEKNFIEIRGNKPILCCGADKSKKRGIPGAKCRSYAGQGTDHPGYGRCKFCGGRNTGPKTKEGKAASRKNGTVHGLYASVLGEREAEIFDQLQKDVLSLEYEINMMKAKILGYLERQKDKWEAFYNKKLQEEYVKYKCKNGDCGHIFVRGALDGKPGYCPKYGCHEKNIEVVERWHAERTQEEAERYADSRAKVYYSEGEGKRSYYHAATIEDKALDRALNTLGRLVEKHARLKGDTSDDLLTSINAELKAASKGEVSVSWSQSPAQRRKGAD